MPAVSTGSMSMESWPTGGFCQRRPGMVAATAAGRKAGRREVTAEHEKVLRAHELKARGLKPADVGKLIGPAAPPCTGTWAWNPEANEVPVPKVTFVAVVCGAGCATTFGRAGLGENNAFLQYVQVLGRDPVPVMRGTVLLCRRARVLCRCAVL